MTNAALTALAVIAHPDDEFHCLGTLMKLHARGARIVIAVATNGEFGLHDARIRPEEVIQLRRAEMENLARAAGAELVWLGFADSSLELHLLQLKAKLTETIRRVRPNILLTHDGWLRWEPHSDHRTVGLAAAEAGYLANSPWHFREQIEAGLAPHAPGSMLLFKSEDPTCTVDIGDVADAKLAAAQLHNSQNRPGTDYGDRLARHLAWRQENNPAALQESFRLIGQPVALR